MRSLSLVVSLAACSPPDAGSGDHLALVWQAGDSFRVAAREDRVAVKGVNETVALAPGAAPPVGERWTPEVAWTYQVVEDDLIPADGDELYPFALDGLGEVRPLDVLKVSLDRASAADAGLVEADPVVYLVFRADRQRLAAVVTFTNVGGVRVSRAVSSRGLDHAWGALSQSRLGEVPTYLAPFAASFADEALRLEDGSEVTTTLVDADTVEARYDDVFGGSRVTSTYERDLPWPVATVAPGYEARLLRDGEGLRVSGPVIARADGPPPDFDFRAALAEAIDVDAALVLDDEAQRDGWLSFVYDAYTPWPGSWWPLKQAHIVFGYDDRDTFSDRIKDAIDPLARRRDEINTELRTLSSADARYAELSAEYQAKTDEEVRLLVDFYDDLRADLDGGSLRVDGGRLVHDEGWSYALDELSPMDKMGLAEHLRDADINNPFYLSAWEILNAYNPAGGSWWGKCNGWSAAAILANEPTEPVTWTAPGGTSLTFTTADQKGLMAASFYGVRSVFYGARYNSEADDITDLSPKAFHHLLEHYLRQQRIPFVFDTDAGDAVWNFPVQGALVEVEEVGGGGTGGKLNVNTASVAELDALPYISARTAAAIVEYRTYVRPFQSVDELDEVYGIGPSTISRLRDRIAVAPTERTFEVTATVTFENDGVDETWVSTMGPTSFDETWSYTLVTDDKGLVLRGTWAVPEEHPDFAWVPYDNPRARSTSGSENPFLEYAALLDVLGESLERR